MARAIDKVRAAYSSAARQLIVPEFDHLELWFSRLTTADMQAVVAREPKDSYEQDLVLLIHKARDAEGKPAFQMGDLHYLKSEGDYVVLRRIVAFMYEATAITAKEAATAVAEDPTSGSA